jgi:hypothetical protein
VRLCMFHPVDHPMERGWVGRIDGEHVTHLAAQSLQSFFTGGGSAREHAVYPRVFENETSFEFANPAAIVGPGAEIARRPDLVVLLRVAAVMGADAEIGGFTLAADWRDGSAAPPKDRDFALGLGPVVVTPEELDSAYRATVLRVDGDEYRAFLPPFDWIAARDIAADGTRLHPGDVLAGPPAAHAVGDGGSGEAELEAPSLGTLRQTVVAR